MRRTALYRERITETELEPIFNRHKSFYGKAQVVQEEIDNVTSITRITHLFSYGTVVVSLMVTTEKGEQRCKVKLHNAWDYGTTTLRHTKEFLHQQLGYIGTKAQIARDFAGN